MANQRGEKAKLQSQTEYPGTKRDHTLRARMNLVKKNTHTQTPQINKRYKSYLTSIYIIILLKPYQIM